MDELDYGYDDNQGHNNDLQPTSDFQENSNQANDQSVDVEVNQNENIHQEDDPNQNLVEEKQNKPIIHDGPIFRSVHIKGLNWWTSDEDIIECIEAPTYIT